MQVINFLIDFTFGNFGYLIQLVLNLVRNLIVHALYFYETKLIIASNRYLQSKIQILNALSSSFQNFLIIYKQCSYRTTIRFAEMLVMCYMSITIYTCTLVLINFRFLHMMIPLTTQLCNRKNLLSSNNSIGSFLCFAMLVQSINIRTNSRLRESQI